MECPLYLAQLSLGALSKDKTNVRMTANDTSLLRQAIADKKKQREEFKKKYGVT